MLTLCPPNPKELLIGTGCPVAWTGSGHNQGHTPDRVIQLIVGCTIFPEWIDVTGLDAPAAPADGRHRLGGVDGQFVRVIPKTV